MNQEVRTILESIATDAAPTLKKLLEVSNDEKKVVLYIHSKLKSANPGLFAELRDAKDSLSFDQCCAIMNYFSSLLTKYPALSSFTDLLITELCF